MRKSDKIGRRFGKLVVISRSGSEIRGGQIVWVCKCDCGNITHSIGGQLTSGKKRSCGCLKLERPYEDFSGKKFGFLTVIKKTDNRDKWDNFLWECICQCGGIALVNSGNLKHGGVTTCGCHMGFKKHGDWNKRIRVIWVNMNRRCGNKSDKQYMCYGGRGIIVCDEWLGEDGYLNFKKWAYENGYDDALTIERIDVNGGYNRDNCKWATHLEQGNNKRTNHFLEIDGTKKTVAQWSRISGTRGSRIIDRIRLGWNPEDAVFKPTNKNKIAKIYRNGY